MRSFCTVYQRVNSRVHEESLSVEVKGTQISNRARLGRAVEFLSLVKSQVYKYDGLKQVYVRGAVVSVRSHSGVVR